MSQMELVASEEYIFPYFELISLVFLALGVLTGRAWVAILPLLAVAGLLGSAAIGSPGYSNSDAWFLVIYVGIYAIPASAAALGGAMIRIVADRRLRRRRMQARADAYVAARRSRRGHGDPNR